MIETPDGPLGGLKLFCDGVGVEHPDITNSSRRIKKSEVKKCARNGVTNITEIKIGYDGIVLANSRAAKQMSISRKDLFLALAKNVPSGQGEDIIVKKLEANPYAFGVFGFSFLDQNADQIQGSLIDGVAPEFEKIASGAYPVSRPLYFYVKDAHVGKIPGMKEYIQEFTSEKTWGPEGYLVDKGLIPMSEEERKKFHSDGKTLAKLIM